MKRSNLHLFMRWLYFVSATLWLCHGFVHSAPMSLCLGAMWAFAFCVMPDDV